MERAVMTKTYKDSGSGSSRYRAVLMFRTVLIVMAAAAATAALFPQMSGLMFSFVCLALMIPALFYQMHADTTLIHTGTVFHDDGQNLYAVLPVFKWGYGRKYHMNKKKTTNEVFLIESVHSIRRFAFGIAVRAEVLCASSAQAGLRMRDFKTPGAAAGLLEAHGRRKSVLFRIERSLTPQDEKELLECLEALKTA